jgi:hypothetical protein
LLGGEHSTFVRIQSAPNPPSLTGGESNLSALCQDRASGTDWTAPCFVEAQPSTGYRQAAIGGCCQ